MSLSRAVRLCSALLTEQASWKGADGNLEGVSYVVDVFSFLCLSHILEDASFCGVVYLFCKNGELNMQRDFGIRAKVRNGSEEESVLSG